MRKNLESLNEAQEKVQISKKIQEIAMEVREVITLIGKNYQNILRIEPLQELNEYFSGIQEQLKELSLPILTTQKEIFKFSHPTKKVENGRIRIEYQIPLVRKNNFTELIIATIPSQKREVLDFNPGRNHSEVTPISKLFIEDNGKFFGLKEETLHLFENVYENFHLKPINSCIKNLLKGSHELCAAKSISHNIDEMIPIDQQLLVLNEANMSESSPYKFFFDFFN